MLDEIKLESVRDLSKLRSLNPERFSKALAHIILDDYSSYLLLLDHLNSYDNASGTDKTKAGYVTLEAGITPDLRSALISFVTEVTDE